VVGEVPGHGKEGLGVGLDGVLGFGGFGVAFVPFLDDLAEGEAKALIAQAAFGGDMANDGDSLVVKCYGFLINARDRLVGHSSLSIAKYF